MAKTYIDTVKYLVYTDVDIDGLVEKPDVVGAIFGQTEGLLGDELDLRDLQKNGRIGRIEVELQGRDGRTVGMIKIPSSLDMVETCIIAAALETVDRVGPCEAKMKVTKVEDTRSVKRKVLLGRAKELLRNLVTTEIPESREISEMVRDEVKVAEITEYGPDRLPAGPGIHASHEILIVEGRADVINLLKNNVTNAIAIQGAKVPASLAELSKKKEVTVFLDGDRGGDIILNELIQGGIDIDYVARAPIGMEVEELTRKELIKCIRNKVPFEQGGKAEQQQDRRPMRRMDEMRPPMQRRREQQTVHPIVPQKYMAQRPVVQEAITVPEEKREERREAPVPAPPPPEVKKPAPRINATREGFLVELDELENTLNARFYNPQYERVAEVPVRDVIKKLGESRDISAIIFDGIITQRLADLAAKQGVKTLVGIKIGNVNKAPEGIEIVTKA
ncbi:DNA primase [Candidatus Micrarchaeota archaeon]|nr:DNA primase [Candidatus Micrarchaeota archaeon]